MADMVGTIFKGMPWYLFVIIIIAIGLLICSFFVPPMGIIDGSVLKAVALILAGTWLLYTTVNIPVFIEKGAKIKASYGNAQIEIGKHKFENENNEGEEQE